MPPTTFNLRIFNREQEESSTNEYAYKFDYPNVSWESYNSVATDPDLQLKLDPNLSEYEVREVIDPQTRLVYLSYRKVLFVSPRDFLYIRFSFEAEGQHWMVAVSVPGEEYFGKVRGTIMMTVSRAFEREGSLHVSVYSHIDMKMKMKPSATKPKALVEIRKMLEREFGHLSQQNSQ